MSDAKCCAQKDAKACEQSCCADSKATWVVQPEGKELKTPCCKEACAKMLKLFYFNGRGRAEVSRLMMVQAGLSWVDVRVPEDEWGKCWKAKMPFGQMPVLCAKGEAQIAQSRAIERYIATYCGLYGRDPLENAKIDMIVEAWTDVMTPFMRIVWEIKDEKEKKTQTEAFFKDTFPRIVGAIEKLLPGKFFVGDRLTYADIITYNCLFGFVAQNAQILKAYPKLEALFDMVGKLPKIEAWVKARPQTPF